MVSIAICDDEIKVGAELERDLIDVLSKLKVEHEIDVYFSSEDLCNKMEAGAHYDLIFLDIEFAKEEINGVEVGRLIREAHYNNMVSIVFISWEQKYSMQLFDIRPLNFLIKPLTHERVKQVAITFLQISGYHSDEFTYKKGYDTYKIKVKSIVYLESNDRKLILHLTNGKKEEFYGSLKEVYNEQLIKFDFLFIHASYAVNYDYVSTVKFNQLLLMDNETILPISVHRRNEVRETYFAIMKRRRA